MPERPKLGSKWGSVPDLCHSLEDRLLMGRPTLDAACVDDLKAVAEELRRKAIALEGDIVQRSGA